MNDLKHFFADFLNIINYPDDKKEFTNKFLNTIYLETIGELIKTLPQDKQELISQTLQSAKTPELLQQAVNNTFDQTLFNKTLQNTSQKVFNEYLQTIDTALTPDQKVKLQQYFASLKSQRE